MRILSTALSLALAGSTALAGQLWVVAPAAGPGVDFTNVNAAVAAAADGDALLLQPGTYPEHVSIAAKALRLFAAVPDTVLLAGLTVTGTAADQTVSARQIAFGYVPGVSPLAALVRIDTCAGHVVLEDLEVAWNPLTFGGDATPAILVADCGAVSLSRCTAVGAKGFYLDDDDTFPYHGGTGGAGLRARRSRIVVSAGSYSGGDAGNLGDGGSASAGGPGIELIGARADIAAGELRGGDGNLGFIDFPCFCTEVGAGGIGLLLSCDFGDADTVRHAATLFRGGKSGSGAAAPGLGSAFCGPSAPHVIESVAGHPATLGTTALWPAGMVGRIAVRGDAGGAVLLGFSADAAFAAPSGVFGAIALAPPLALVPAGILPPSGLLEFETAAPHLPAGIEVLGLIVQAFVDAPGQDSASAPSALLLLDS